MKIRFHHFLCLGFLFLGLNLPAQNSEDLILAKALHPAHVHSQNRFKKYAKGNKGLLSKAAAGLFLFYKSFISSQDSRQCSFEVSCSEYAMIAIRKHGFFSGIVRGFDRYSRCTNMHRRFYEQNSRTGRLKDPLE